MVSGNKRRAVAPCVLVVTSWRYETLLERIDSPDSAVELPVVQILGPNMDPCPPIALATIALAFRCFSGELSSIE